MDSIYSVNNENVLNIIDLSKKRMILEERRICELREIAAAAVKYAAELVALGMTAYEVLALIYEKMDLPPTELRDDTLEDFVLYLRRESDSHSSFDRAVLCAFLREELIHFGIDLSEEDFLSASASAETFTYVKNAFSDEAYDVFAQEFHDPRVTYVSALKDAAALVAAEKVTYCILPIEERGVRLSTVTELLLKYDLKINSIISVLGLDGMADVKYALVSKAFLIPKVLKDDDRYLEIRIPVESDLSLSELLAVAGYYGIEIHRLNTLVFDGDGGRNFYYMAVFRADGTDFVSLLIYLTLYTNEFTPIGLYTNLE